LKLAEYVQKINSRLLLSSLMSKNSKIYYAEWMFVIVL